MQTQLDIDILIFLRIPDAEHDGVLFAAQCVCKWNGRTLEPLLVLQDAERKYGLLTMREALDVEVILGDESGPSIRVDDPSIPPHMQDELSLAILRKLRSEGLLAGR